MTDKLDSNLHKNSGISAFTKKDNNFINGTAGVLFGAVTIGAASLLLTALISGNPLTDKGNAIKAAIYAASAIGALFVVGFVSSLAGSRMSDDSKKPSFKDSATDAVKGGVAAVAAPNALRILSDVTVDNYKAAKQV